MRRRVALLGALIAGVPWLFAGAPSAPPARAERTTWDSVYSDVQAVRGEGVYIATCSACHLASLSGADQVPALAGSTFIGKWDGLTLGELHDRIRRTMPPSDPGSYARRDVTDVIAYLLRENEFPAGKAELSGDAAALNDIRIAATR